MHRWVITLCHFLALVNYSPISYDLTLKRSSHWKTHTSHSIPNISITIGIDHRNDTFNFLYSITPHPSPVLQRNELRVYRKRTHTIHDIIQPLLLLYNSSCSSLPGMTIGSLGLPNSSSSTFPAFFLYFSHTPQNSFSIPFSI